MRLRAALAKRRAIPEGKATQPAAPDVRTTRAPGSECAPVTQRVSENAYAIDITYPTHWILAMKQTERTPVTCGAGQLMRRQ